MGTISKIFFLRANWVIALVGGVIGISYLLKELLIAFALSHGDVVLIPGIVTLTLSWNRGISYGLFPYSGGLGAWILLWGTCVLSLLFLLWGLMTVSSRRALALTLIASGGLANVVNRLEDGAVADFFAISLIPFLPAFICNFADMVITLGSVLFLWQEMMFYKKGQKA